VKSPDGLLLRPDGCGSDSQVTCSDACGLVTCLCGNTRPNGLLICPNRDPTGLNFRVSALAATSHFFSFFSCFFVVLLQFFFVGSRLFSTSFVLLCSFISFPGIFFSSFALFSIVINCLIFLFIYLFFIFILDCVLR
jgi:hypothetical protein